VIPRKGIMEIRKLVDTDPENLRFGIRQGMCIVKTSDTVLKVSLVEAEYPDYRRILPKEKGSVVLLKRDEFLQALRRMSVISSDRYSGVILELKEGRMIMTSTNPDVGEASDEMDVPYRDKELRVGYNVHYLMEAVEVVDGESLEFEIGFGMKPSVVRQAGNDRYFCMIMPLKV
jgi:DNA polymerase-3 subunit beta